MQHDPIGLAGGLNPYLYAQGNPLKYSDRLGLSSADVDAIRRHVAESFPDIRVNPSWGFDTLMDKRGAYATTGVLSGKLWVDVKYEAECLPLDDFRELYGAVLHESMHNTDGVFGRMSTNMQDSDAQARARRDGRDPRGVMGPRHRSIYNREEWEMGRTVIGAEPNWPMWGIPRVDRLERPIISPQVDALYERTRTEVCGCN